MKRLMSVAFLFFIFGSGLVRAQEDISGTVIFMNHISGVVEAPVSLPDGRGAGALPGMVAQLFRVTLEGLTPCQPATVFRINNDPRQDFYVETVFKAYVPESRYGTWATLRMRVWESTKGSTYEEARLSGGYFGDSNDVTLQLGGKLYLPPPPLIGLKGFTLQRLPMLAVDSLSLKDRRMNLSLLSNKNHLLEQSVDLINWWPAEVFQASGTNQVQLPQDAGALFFRAVLLDF